MARRRGRPRYKRAVVVGINNYQAGGSNINLEGCVPDAVAFYKTLVKFYRFRKKHVKLLLNENATKQNIMNALNWMLRKTKKKQEAVYFHSGHGSQVADVNGDEEDKLDECIIPYDFNWENVITDDDLFTVFKQLPKNGYLSMICDTCYSGGLHKGLNLVGRHGKLLPLPIAEKHRNLPVSHYGVKDKSPGTQRHILISGCREGGYSEEFYHPTEGWRGVLTFYIVRHLWKYRKKGLTFAQLFSRIQNKIAVNGFVQSPTILGMETLRNRGVFGGRR